MSWISKGRTETCNNSIGGLKAIYLFNFTHYKSYLMTFNGSFLTSYPNTTIYRYELLNDANTFNEDLQESEEGNSYVQSLSVTLKGVTKNRNQVFSLLGKTIGVITESRLGNFNILGLKNGCKVKKINENLGGARSDFSGFKIEIEAKEKESAFFISDLSGAGFNLPGGFDFLLQENLDFLLQENNDKIII